MKMQFTSLHPDDGIIELGDPCPYCAEAIDRPYKILICHHCGRQACYDCVPAGVCCLQDDVGESEPDDKPRERPRRKKNPNKTKSRRKRKM